MGGIADRVKSLNLPLDQVIVAGSAILDILDIRQSHDIDLIVTPQVFNTLKNQPGAVSEVTATGNRIITNAPTGEVVESWLNWRDYRTGEDIYFDRLKTVTSTIDGVMCLSLPYVREWKVGRGREKDLADVVLIDNYLEQTND